MSRYREGSRAGWPSPAAPGSSCAPPPASASPPTIPRYDTSRYRYIHVARYGMSRYREGSRAGWPSPAAPGSSCAPPPASASPPTIPRYDTSRYRYIHVARYGMSRYREGSRAGWPSPAAPGSSCAPPPAPAWGVTIPRYDILRYRYIHVTRYGMSRYLQENRGKLDKSHSTPAYDFNNSQDEPGSLVTQIIPESPTTPNDSPTILVHSAEKADQILDFKKSSTQIEEAIQQQQSKRQNGDEKSKFPFNEKDEEVNKVLETINIAMIEHQNKEQKTRLSTYKSTSPEHKNFPASEHVKTIQNEIVQAINEQRVGTNVRSAPKPVSIPEVAPAPPPRPICTQKPIIKEPQLPMKEMKVPFPVLKPVRQPEVIEQHTPLKPFKHGEPIQISVPLSHITKHDIQMIPSERRELPPLNCEINLNVSQSDVSKVGKDKDSPSLSQSQSLQRLESPVSLYSPVKTSTLSPTTASVVRGIFPSSKSKSLKKKNSILAKGRHVPFRVWSVYASLAGRAWQRVRAAAGAGGAGAAGGAGGARWAPRALLLADDRLLAYRGPQCSRADCVIYLSGFTVSEAPEVKSRPYAFKVYHTGKVFYFSVGGGAALAAWTQALARATLPGPSPVEESKQFSETDYSDEESDTESPEKRLEQKDRERERERDKEREKDKDRDKSKFGSLKKLTHRMQRSESQEHVGHSSTSLDRKYLRFFSRNKNKDENKANKNKPVVAPVVVPTEHYRSYRRAPSSDLSPASPDDPRVAPPAPPAPRPGGRLPTPINYIHASNPNLLDFEKSDFAAKPNLQIPLPKSKVHKPDNFIGLVTLEEFMLKKQEEERQQVYSNRVLMGIERDKKSDESNKRAAKDLQKQLEKIVPDVIYGELPTYSDDKLPVPVVEQIQSRTLPKTPERADKTDKSHMKPVSIKGKDGYEKIVYTSDGKLKSRRDSEPTEPPKIKPRKLSRPSPDIARKSSLTSAKDLGYEVIYGDEGKADSKSVSRNMSTTSSKDLGYETVFGEADNSAKGSCNSVFERRASDDRPAPPKIMPKSMQVLNRQSSLTSTTSRTSASTPTRTPGDTARTPGGDTARTPSGDTARAAPGSGVDTSPVFLQGESPEKFWLNSLRRNDKVVAFPSSSSSSPGGSKPLKSARNYSPVTLPPAPAPLAAAPAPRDRCVADCTPRHQQCGRLYPPPPAVWPTVPPVTLPPAPAPLAAAPAPRDRSPSPPTGMSRLRAMFSRPRPRPPQEVPPTTAEEGPAWAVHYPHLQCPPTFEPETYSLQPRILHKEDKL
ncbi:unnamed protein product [Plutella xylostella]|uniref:(diamondback moth) hypothetical protein n=1 Tax=Plutella xylostella TaxID=51655 RepID=A0A8S4G7I2_PLUXY|nr:unnamed protein product [Plutella xylostella]